MNDERQTMKTQQLELTFDGSQGFEPRVRSQPARAARAQWWFAQIHQLISRAAVARPPGRPEQVHLALPGRAAPAWAGSGQSRRLAPVWK
jgi:hypothetical protein